MTTEELYSAIGGDYNAARRILMNDAMISRFIVKLLDDTSYDRLMSAWAAADEKGIFEAAHAMKGVYANLGVTGIASLASEITEEFRPGKERTLSPEALKEKMAAMESMHETMIRAIREFKNQ